MGPCFRRDDDGAVKRAARMQSHGDVVSRALRSMERLRNDALQTRDPGVWGWRDGSRLCGAPLKKALHRVRDTRDIVSRALRSMERLRNDALQTRDPGVWGWRDGARLCSAPLKKPCTAGGTRAMSCPVRCAAWSVCGMMRCRPGTQESGAGLGLA